MNLDIQKAIRDAIAAGGEMKAVAIEHGVPFGTVRKAAKDGWPEIPSLPHGGGGERNPGEVPSASAPPAPSSASPTTLEKLEAIAAEINPKMRIRDTTRIIHLHLLRILSKGELKIADLRPAGQLTKDLLYIEQNTGAAKESDLELIAKLYAAAESGNPEGILDLYRDGLTASQGVTNPEMIARDDPEPEAIA